MSIKPMFRRMARPQGEFSFLQQWLHGQLLRNMGSVLFRRVEETAKASNFKAYQALVHHVVSFESTVNRIKQRLNFRRCTSMSPEQLQSPLSFDALYLLIVASNEENARHREQLGYNPLTVSSLPAINKQQMWLKAAVTHWLF